MVVSVYVNTLSKNPQVVSLHTRLCKLSEILYDEGYVLRFIPFLEISRPWFLGLHSASVYLFIHLKHRFSQHEELLILVVI